MNNNPASNISSDHFSNNRGTTATASRLANPTAYHMQQMRYKDSMGIDPSQMMGNAHLIFAQQQQQQQQLQQQQQQQQQDSPNLSDLDYSELANSSPMTGEFQPSARSSLYQQNDSNEYIFDEDQAMKQQQYTYAIQMKRCSTEIDGGMVAHHQQYQQQHQQQPGYYPSSFENDSGIHSRLKQFAGSAPSNMGYHGGMYSSFAGSDDMISVAASQSTNLTSTKRGSATLIDNDSASNHELLDDSYVEDYSNQAK